MNRIYTLTSKGLFQVFFTFVFILLANQFAYAANSIRLAPTAATASSNGKFNISVFIDNDTPLSALTFKVTFDAAILSVAGSTLDSTVEVKAGASTNGWFVTPNNITAGQVTVGLFGTSNLPAGANQEIIVLTFTVNSAPSKSNATIAINSATFNENITPTLGASTAFTLLTNNSAPVMSPLVDRTISPGKSLTFTVTATDSDPTDILTYSATGLPSGATFVNRLFDWTPSSSQSGVYPITFSVSDGKTSTSATMKITVNDLPSVTLTSPSLGATFTAPATIAMTATAADSDGSISKVEFYSGSTLLFTDTASPFAFTQTDVPQGTYSLTAKAYDNVGDAATSSVVNVSVNATAANVPPAVSITAPTQNAIVNGPANVTVTATAADIDGTVSRVDFYNGNTLIGSDATAPFSISWSNVAAGVYVLTAKAFDNSGDSTTSAAVNFTVNALPTVAFTSISNGATYSAPANITLTATATDSDGTISSVAFYSGTNLLATVNQAPFTYLWSNVLSGTYAITAKATDDRGQVSTTAAVNVIVNSFPTGRFVTPTANQSFYAPANVPIEVTATDSDGSIVRVDIYNGSTLIASDTTAPYTATLTDLPIGTYGLKAIAFDNNNTFSLFGPLTINVVASPIVAPTVSLTSPTSGSEFDAPATIKISALAEDRDGTIARVEFYQNNILIGTDTTAPYEINTNALAAGTYAFFARAYDNDENKTDSAIVTTTVKIPNTVPVAQDLSLATDTDKSVGVTLTATDANNDVLTYTIVSQPQHGALTGTAPRLTYTPQANYAGSDSFTYKANDGQADSNIATVSLDVKTVPVYAMAITPTQNIMEPNGNVVLTLKVSNNVPLSSMQFSLGFDGTVLALDSDAQVALTSKTSSWFMAVNRNVSGSLSVAMFSNGAGLAAGTQQDIITITFKVKQATSQVSKNLTLSQVELDGNTQVALSQATFTLNHAPTLASIPAQVINAGSAFSYVLNYTDQDNDTLTVKTTGLPTGATFNSQTKTITWTPKTSDIGSYTIGVEVSDGRVSTTGNVSLRVNNPPTVSFVSPANNSTFIAPATITLTAAPLDTDGSLAKVVFSQGNTVIATVTSAPFSTTWSNTNAGTYAITALAYDNDGAVSSPASVSVIINDPVNLAPTVSMTNPSADAIITAGGSVVLGANAVDSDGTISVVEFYQGTTLLGSDNTSPFNFTWSNVPTGKYVLTAKAIDNKGATAVSSPINLISNQLPTVTLTSPKSSDSFITPGPVAFSAQASDADDSIKTVEFYADATLIGSDSIAPFTYTWSSVLAGTYVLTAKAIDSRNGATTSSPVNITVDPLNVAPIAQNVNIVTDQNKSVNVTLDAIDPDGQSLTYTIVTQPTHGTLSQQAPNLLYTPQNGYSGTDTFTFKANDGKADSNVARVSITINQLPNFVLKVSPINSSAEAGKSVNVTVALDHNQSVSSMSFSLKYDSNVLTLAGFTAGDANRFWTVNSNIATPGTVTASMQNTSPLTAGNNHNMAVLSFIVKNVSAPVNSNITLTQATIENQNSANSPYVTLTSGIFTLLAGPPNVSPVISLTSPGINQVFTAPATVSITANASDSDGTVTKVEFYQGTILLQTDNTAPFAFDWTNVSEGTYSLSAKAYDNASGVTLSAAVPISVLPKPNAVPTVSITSPKSNQSFLQNANIVIAANAQDEDGTIDQVIFYQNGQPMFTDKQAPYEWTMPSDVLGQFNIMVRAFDNKGSFSDSQGIEVLIQEPVNQLPVASFISPGPNDLFTALANVTMTVDASDPDGSIAQVIFMQDNATIATFTTKPYTVQIKNLDEGSYFLKAIVRDNKGGESQIARTVTVGPKPNQAPQISLISPKAQDQIVSPATINISAQASDPDGSIAKVEFYAGTTLLGEATKQPYAFSWTNVSSGQYQIIARAYDNLGLTASAVVTISVSLPPNKLPQVTLTSPKSGEVFDPSAKIVLNADASDSDGSIVSVDFYLNGLRFGGDQQAPYSIEFPLAAGGDYEFLAIATDDRGGTATSVAVKVRANHLPTIDLIKPEFGAKFALPADIVLEAQVSDQDGTITKVEFYEGTTLLSTINSEPYRFTYKTTDAGTRSFRAKAYDSDGAVISSSATRISLDNAPVAFSMDVDTKKNQSVDVILDGDDQDGDAIAFTVVSQPLHGVLSGEPPVLTYTPERGYTGDDEFTFKVSDGFLESSVETVGITVEPLPSFNVTATSGEGGRVTPQGVTTVDIHEDVVLTITPESGYMIDEVLLDGKDVTGDVLNNTLTLSDITAAHAVKVSFKLLSSVNFTVVAIATEGGSISPSGILTLKGDSTQEFTITPNKDYAVKQLKLNGQVQPILGDTFTIKNLDGNKTVEVSFAANTATITASATSGGAISPLGVVNVTPGGNQKFTVTPLDGFAVNQVLVNNNAVSLTDNTYTFTNVSGSQTISVDFVLSQKEGEEPVSNGAKVPSLRILSPANNSTTYNRTPILSYLSNGRVIAVELDGKKISVSGPGRRLPRLTPGSHTVKITVQNAEGYITVKTSTFTIKTLQFRSRSIVAG